MPSHTPKEFIQVCLIDEIGQIIDKGHPYPAFSLIASGIEFLGKCLNPNPTWDYSGQSGSDIDKVITDHMPQYSALRLADELRNGMLHMFRPKSSLSLAYYKHTYIGTHLELHPTDATRTVIEIKQFHNDFSKACREIIEKIDAGEFPSGNKIYGSFLTYD